MKGIVKRVGCCLCVSGSKESAGHPEGGGGGAGAGTAEGGDRGTPTSAPTSPGADTNASPLARNPLRGSKCNRYSLARLHELTMQRFLHD